MEYRFCGNCGQPLPEVEVTLARPTVRLTPAAPVPPPAAPAPTTASLDPAPPPAPTTPSDNTDRGPSSIALVGFGAILALASASYPWYLFGLYGDTQEATLSEVLQDGWQWFPGLPLVLIRRFSGYIHRGVHGKQLKQSQAYCCLGVWVGDSFLRHVAVAGLL